ncbi:MAG: helix-turn-helix transcriptional regulator [Erysipelotrichales bacterium]|nr:helix-turn-helix transcriptional regulator [Erysipelotrichales bacterium]MBQ1386565.1 helix-turn-helix transcriptional regulator [Erysipelotrichales bacterium]MBQ2309670.1 helix-turn-helix transcriptional regulator [Erysipelotrichales bacterium]MBQ4374570.1 helix-turn-helix transcriptional regulator [Erysipelotrichales bacterium]MBQ5543244.1 helix-turn-helix transcriptional regulator [Erysipelotrichales bacterium]
MNIGTRIRELRIKSNLTQEELASRTELSKGFLSQLENDMASPSVATLQDIVEALGTDMSTFFREEKENAEVFREEDIFVDEREERTVRYIVPNAQKNEMEPIVVELDPGGSSEEVEPFEGEEFGYVLAGRVTLVIGDKEYVLKKGETFYLHGEKSHILRNDSKTRASVLWVSTPPVF